MSITLFRGKWDDRLRKIEKALASYARSHQDARISIYRQNSASIRIRVIDPSFEDVSPSRREKIIWWELSDLPDDIYGEITFLLLLTPDEGADSLANHDFENPLPSRL